VLFVMLFFVVISLVLFVFPVLISLVLFVGFGKTTLATEVYNHFMSHRLFQLQSFSKDVRSSVPFEMQRQLLHDLIEEDLHSNTLAGRGQTLIS
jgi:hypothetical protein